MKKYITTVLLAVAISLISASCSTTSKGGSQFVDEKGNPISEQQYNEIKEQERLKAEEEAFYDACDAESTGEHEVIVDDTIWLWGWVSVVRGFVKGLLPEWWY